MHQALAAGNDHFGVPLRGHRNPFGLAPIQLIPLIAAIVPVYLAVHVARYRCRAPHPVFLRNNGFAFAADRIERNDLARGIADAEIDPARVIGGNAARILPPVLFVNPAIIPQLTGLGVVANHAAVRIGDRPDAPGIVLGHAHGHLRFGFRLEGEGTRRGIVFGKMAGEMCVEAIAGRQNGSVGTVTCG